MKWYYSFPLSMLGAVVSSVMFPEPLSYFISFCIGAYFGWITEWD